MHVDMLTANQNNMTTALLIGIGIVIYALLFKAIDSFEKI